MTNRTASIIGGIGRFLIGLGLVVLSFAAFQLWGTGLQEARAQNQLESDFEVRQAELAALLEASPELADAQPADPETDNPVIESPAVPAVAPELAAQLLPDRGEVLGTIEIPSIDMERSIVEGVSRGDLRQGPGHYPGSPLPGQAGNASIAGHRTTYGEPFRNLDLLEPGDEIFVETLQGRFRYEVMSYENEEGDDVGHFIVDPSQVEILEDFGDNRLTLTACHPVYSARQRIIVTAVLADEPAPLLPLTETDPIEDALDDAGDEVALDEGQTVGVEENALDESLGWNFEERTPTIIWGAIAAIVLAIGMIVAKLWGHKWLVYAGTTPFFLAALFVCFTHLDRLLPAL